MGAFVSFPALWETQVKRLCAYKGKIIGAQNFILLELNILDFNLQENLIFSH